MANQKVKCRQCGKQVDKSSAIEIKPRQYVCSQQCADIYRLAHEKQKPQNKPLSDVRRLTDYVQSYAPNTAWVKFGANVQRMCKDGMTIAGIHYTLRYIREYEGKQVQGDGLALVPYYYDAAKAYYQWQQRMKQQIAEWTPADNEAVVVRYDDEEDVFV